MMSPTHKKYLIDPFYLGTCLFLFGISVGLSSQSTMGLISDIFLYLNEMIIETIIRVKSRMIRLY